MSSSGNGIIASANYIRIVCRSKRNVEFHQSTVPKILLKIIAKCRMQIHVKLKAFLDKSQFSWLPMG